MTDGQLPPPQWAPDPTEPGKLRYWDGKAWTEHQAPVPPAGPLPVAAANAWPPLRIAAIVSAAAMIVGTALPWMEVGSGFGSVSRSGLDGGGDGLIIALAAAGAILFAIAAKYLPYTILVVVAGLLVAWDFYDVWQRVADVEDEEFLVASVGIGLWLLVAATVASIAIGANLLGQSPSSGSAES